jgi:polyisoprenyl-teichoic acid--peptidoglycan teichoic acid transferase
MTKRSKLWIAIGGVILFLLVVGLIIFPTIQQKMSAPLGPGLDLPTYTPTTLLPTNARSTAQPTATENKKLTAVQPTHTSTAPTKTSSKPTPTAKPLCGGPAVMTILGIGADHGQSSDYLYGLGDAIRIVRVDFVTPKVTALTIPRDIWVDIPGVSDHGITQGKLNQSYFYGNKGMGYYDGPGGGPGLMARTLDLNFGLRPDHYGAVNMEVFKRIVDAIGGIDIYLPTDVDGTPIDNKTANMGYFTAGQHHFNGDQALRFSRIRKRYNDFTRGDFQNMVVCALQKKLTSPETLTKIPKIISAFQGQVLTDLSLEQFGQLACLLPKLDRKNIIFTSFPQEIFSPGRQFSPQQKDETFVLEADPAVIRDYVSQFMSGAWPTQPDEPTCK